MFKNLVDWLDHRTGCRKLVEALLIEHIPGGAKWRYVWGSTLAFVFTIQLMTGVLLMTAYSPGSSSAWASVWFIQYQMDFGWLIRGLHHFGSQTMVVLLGLHMLQVVIAGAHLPPREINWWLGLGLMGTVLGLSLTGYLLPWDQKGFWATQVATNIAGNMPVMGPYMQKIIIGGPEYGNHTLTRFFTLHVGILPPLTIVLIILHLAVFRRHGVTTPVNAKGEGWFWPEQAFRDLLVSLIIFAIMLALVFWGHGHKVESTAEGGWYDRLAHAGRAGLGANLDAPADPGTEGYPARPEWYFLFLFQTLKYFEGPLELVGTVIIPMAAGGLLFVLPLLGYGRMRRFGHGVGVVVVSALLLGAATMTGLALWDDRRPEDFTEDQVKALPDLAKKDYERRKLFHDKLADAEVYAQRAVQRAQDGIPVEGPMFLLRNDPETAGRKAFGLNCAVCHNHGEDFKNPKATASDLAGFGTRAWVRGLLSDPGSSHYFGNTKLSRMAGWVETARDKAKEEGKEPELDATFDAIADWLAEHPRGEMLPAFKAKGINCARCHAYQSAAAGSSPARSGPAGGGTAGPDLTGYGDAEWLRQMIMSPFHEARYGTRNAMPAFRDLEGPAAEVTKQDRDGVRDLLKAQIAEDDPKTEAKQKQIDNATRLMHLSDIDRELIIRWLLKDHRVVFGGAPIAAPPKR